MSLHALAAGVADLLAELDASPGYVTGIYHAGEQITLGHGIANVVSRSAMTASTCWQAGSITKVMTTTLLMRWVERGDIALADPVTKHLPELRLADPSAADLLTVEMLLNHTNGIDADSLFPGGEQGPNAVASYLDAVAGCGLLFRPGTGMTYSNPGFAIAGRIIEKLAGAPFNTVLETELYQPLGMLGAITSAEAAMLRNTAVGTFADDSGGFRQTGMFMLPPAAAAAGTTPIVTTADLLAFARMHLADGDGYLSQESIRRMRTPTVDLHTPGIPAYGLGWMLSPVGSTTAAWHAGGSPGGVSQLVVFPEHDLAIAGYGNSSTASIGHDAVVASVVGELLGSAVTEHLEPAGPCPDLEQLTGTYEAADMRHEVRLGEHPDELEITSAFLDLDPEHGRLIRAFTGSGTLPTDRVRHLRDRLFGPADCSLEDVSGLFGRMELVSFHGPERPSHLHRSSRRTNRRP